jgi:hypothetical protein
MDDSLARVASVPKPSLTESSDQHTVVTFTLHNALVTLLGVNCKTGIEPDVSPHVSIEPSL